MSAYFAAGQVLDRQGSPRVYRRLSDKGRWIDYRFCETCGVTVWWEAEFLPGRVGVAGALIEDFAFSPDGAYFCATKPDWVTFADGVPVAPGATTSAKPSTSG